MICPESDVKCLLMALLLLLAFALVGMIGVSDPQALAGLEPAGGQVTYVGE